ncbi:hypothetical protein J7E88_27290 [Streptomyces sp. ISL-10]|uniref:hypothetical protein n=1 Tax=Streptomyces sp. ISL-10 TaxID=2819172 RepID=UPI001BEA5640|nr:hypothetical protein [Streptomyces sp. ISL-10]MBT2368919.1 hypothetical protein [Streptomyces sp. ISL-10]
MAQKHSTQSRRFTESTAQRDQIIKTWNGEKEADGVESKVERRLNARECCR